MKSVRVLSPAKVNLGLAVLGKRDDGYHEIDTIMAMIDLCDEITITPGPEREITIHGMDDVPLEANLMWKAARLWGESAGVHTGLHIDIDKRIPSPGGLGGGSSNAAAVLTALNHLYDNPLNQQELHLLATQLGADCPFFLDGPSARATGTGTELRSVPHPTGWLILAVPASTEQAKTARLYGALTGDDWGISTEIDAIEQHLNTGTLGDAGLPNSFSKPAMKIFPNLSNLHSTMSSITGKAVVSGAGPGLYTIAECETEAAHWASQLAGKVTGDVTIRTARFLDSPPRPEITR